MEWHSHGQPVQRLNFGGHRGPVPWSPHSMPHATCYIAMWHSRHPRHAFSHGFHGLQCGIASALCTGGMEGETLQAGMPRTHHSQSRCLALPTKPCPESTCSSRLRYQVPTNRQPRQCRRQSLAQGERMICSKFDVVEVANLKAIDLYDAVIKQRN